MKCVICGKDGCNTYPLMIERYAAGRDVEHWRRIHDRLNGLAAGEPIDAAYPSLLTQAGSALKAVAGFVASGGAMASTEEHARRRSICGACEHLDAAADRCRKCGCFLAVKPWMAREKCPDTPPRW